MKEQPESGLLHGEITGIVIAAFYETYNRLGFGHLESVYRRALAYELHLRGVRVECEKLVRVYYKEIVVGYFRTDMVAEDKVVLELKPAETLSREDPRQLLNCLRSTRLDVGLLLHYGREPKFHRIVAQQLNTEHPPNNEQD